MIDRLKQPETNQMTNKRTTTIRYHIQASINGGAWHDIDAKGFKTSKQAEKRFDRILKECFPTWRGLSVNYKIIRRRTTVETDTEIIVFSTPSHGKKRILLAEMFVPSWLPDRVKARLKMRRIPGADEQWQPGSQLPLLNQPTPARNE